MKRKPELLFIVIILTIVLSSCFSIGEEDAIDSGPLSCIYQENIENPQTIGEVIIGEYLVTVGRERDQLGFLYIYSDGTYCFEKDSVLDNSTFEEWESTFAFVSYIRGDYIINPEEDVDLDTKISEIDTDSLEVGKISIQPDEALPLSVWISTRDLTASFVPWWSIMKPWSIKKPFKLNETKIPGRFPAGDFLFFYSSSSYRRLPLTRET